MTNEIEYKKTGNLLEDAKVIIESAQKFAYSAINFAIIQRNWLLEKRIAEEDLHGEKRASYGKQIIKKLSEELTDLYGKGFDASNLYKYSDFYQTFQNLDTLRLNSLSWSHYRILLQVENAEARSWYEKEAAAEIWSTRTLQRNVSSQYYERTLLSQHKELGKGYAFVARQQHIHTEKEDYYIDLVFYNYILKCFVLIDLKTSKITHQDVGQMDMYVRMYDDLKRSDGDNPTLGIILCSDTDDDIAKYSILHGNETLFASKYKLYLPDEERLKAEIEAQKEIFRLQHSTEGRTK